MVNILPVNLFVIPKFRNNNFQLSNQALIASNTPDTFECSFTGNISDNSEWTKFSVKSLDLSPAAHSHGIHCPACGVEMLPEEEFDKLVEKSKSVYTTKALVSLIKAHKHSIPANMQKILAHTDSEKDLSKSIHEFFAEHAIEAKYEKQHAFQNSKDYLVDISQTFPSALKNDVDNIVESVTEDETYQSYRGKIIDLILSPDIENFVKDDIMHRSLAEVRATSSYNAVFNIPDSETLAPNELATQIVTNLFKYSVMKPAKIQTSDKYINNKNNDIFLCSRCERSKKKNMYMDFNCLDNIELTKDNIKMYLLDISRLMGNGVLEYNPYYINNFCFVSNKLSKGVLTYDKTEIDRLKKAALIISRHDSFAPIEQDSIIIPCACCGSGMLPHSKRREIRLDLMDANKPIQYANVLKKYEDYVGMYTRDLVDDIYELVEEKPQISNHEFAKIIAKKADIRSGEQTKEVVAFFDKHKNFLLRSLGNKQKQYLIDFDKRLKDYLAQGGFDDYNYTNLFNALIGNTNLPFDSTVATKPIYVLLEDLKRVAYMNSLAKINEYSDQIDKDPAYTIVYNIFKADVATGDHFIAAYNGGEGDKENLIGLCKACNFLKGRKSAATWFSQNHTVRQNFHKQLLVVDQMSQDGLIEGYEGWAKRRAEQLYELSNGLYDKRDLFED